MTREPRDYTAAEMRIIKGKIIARYPDRVADVENEGMDPGRFFIHLRPPWTYDDGCGTQRTKSFGGLREAYAILKTVEKEIT